MSQVDQASASENVCVKKRIKRKVITAEEKEFNRKVKEYKKDMKKYLMTSVFNNNTAKQNQIYREQHPTAKCMYGTPEPISREVPTESIMFVLEMNNDKNKIIGIGMVRNIHHIHKYRVYDNPEFNRYTFVGKMRIDRKEMDAEEDEIMRAFDILCFKGNSHMKRLKGLKCFPIKTLYRCLKVIDLLNFVSNMFKKRMK